MPRTATGLGSASSSCDVPDEPKMTRVLLSTQPASGKIDHLTTESGYAMRVHSAT